MTTGTQPRLDSVSANGDPGDATAQRFRYQWIMAAYACCMLIEDIEEVEEVFCEHHEDVLLKHTDGRFTGQQIKTRAGNQPAWKSSDEAVLGSCARFARLQAKFGDQFREFQFLTNHSIYTAENGASLFFILQQCRNYSPNAALHTKVRAFIKKVAKEARCAEEVALAALAKTKASHDFPKLPDAVARLVNTLSSSWRQAEHCSIAALYQVSERLIAECSKASSLAHEEVLPAYLPMSANQVKAEMAALINGKRMNKARLLDVLETGLALSAPLHGDPADIVPPKTGSTDLLQAKLDAGGFSLPSFHAAEDLRNKADFLGLAWGKKYGDAGLQRYDHIRSIVLSEGAAAFEATQTPEPFGLKMRSYLRSRFEERRKAGTNFYDCSNEHLEGFAYALTAQCKLQWSQARPWEKQK